MSPSILSADQQARRLLADCGLEPWRELRLPSAHPALRWAQSGAMALTGRADGAATMLPLPLASAADAALAALASLAPPGALDGIDGAALLSERAACAGSSRQGAVSPGGACRLLDAADGGFALNLTRPDDWALLPAWLECDTAPADWDALQALACARPRAELIERGRLLGLAIAADAAPADPLAAWCRAQRLAPARACPPRPPRVIDLSSLWAGPLCAQLLSRLGADVVKLESPQRPDGARSGPRAFYELMNAGKRSVAIDPTTPQGRAQWQALLASADIVIEASRPRALRQLGFDAEALVRERGLTWISLTGYGREEPQAQWVAYGDDAGVAAGLSAVLREASGERLFCADAIADPLTGLHAALAAWAGWRRGGGELLALSLRDVVSHIVHRDLPADAAALRERQREWTALALAAGGAQPPRARPAGAAARPLGADNAGVRADWNLAC